MDIRSILMGLAFSFFWSSAFTSARIIVAGAPPLLALGIRFAIAGLIAIALAFALGQSWKLTRTQWIATLLFGLCQNALYLGLNFIAMQTVEASLAVIVASTLPLLVAFASWVILGETLGPRAIVGLVAGFCGAGLVMATRIEAGVDPFGLSLCVIGAIALTAATMLLRGASSGGNYLMIVGIQMLVGAAPLGILGLLTEAPVVIPSWELLAAFTYTLVFPGLIATIVWFNLVNRIGPTKSATFHFLNPFLGVAVAALVLGESITSTDILGVFVIMGGILLVQSSRTSDNAVKAAPD